MAIETTIEERDRQKAVSELEAHALRRREGLLVHRFLEPRQFVQYVEEIADVIAKEIRRAQDVSTAYSFSYDGRTISEIAGRFRAYECVDTNRVDRDQQYRATATITATGFQITVETLPVRRDGEKHLFRRKTHGIEVRFKTTQPVTDAFGYMTLGQAFNEVKRYLRR